MVTFVLIVWGAVVRSFEAGLACPDWPLCHGKIIPPFETLVLLEWTHRLLAALVSVLTIWMVVVVFWNVEFRNTLWKSVLLALVVLISQALLGAITVKAELKAHWVAFHLAIAMFFLLILLSMFLKLKGAKYQWYETVSVSFRRFLTFGLWGLLFVIYGQIVLGGWVSASHAGLACPDFPTCLGSFWPAFIGMVGIHYGHRLLAYVVLILVGFFVWIIYRQKQFDPKFKKAMVAILGMVVVQLGLGIGNVLFALPSAIRILHLAMATMILAMTYVTVYKFSHARLS